MEVGLITRLMAEGCPWPVPASGILVGPVGFVALCVISRTPLNGPAPGGVNLTTTEVDCPCIRLKAPLPLTTEKGPVGSPTVPVSVPVEFEPFVRVIVRSAVCPVVTFPKSTEVGSIKRLIPEGGAETVTLPTIPMEQWGIQK